MAPYALQAAKVVFKTLMGLPFTPSASLAKGNSISWQSIRHAFQENLFLMQVLILRTLAYLFLTYEVRSW